MKIFIGGMRVHHQQRFAREYPDIHFEFATLDETWDRWLAKARRCEHIIIDQSRTDHRRMEHIQKLIRIPVYLTDSKARMRQLIKEIVQHGYAYHHYSTGGRCSFTRTAFVTAEDHDGHPVVLGVSGGDAQAAASARQREPADEGS